MKLEGDNTQTPRGGPKARGRNRDGVSRRSVLKSPHTTDKPQQQPAPTRGKGKPEHPHGNPKRTTPRTDTHPHKTSTTPTPEGEHTQTSIHRTGRRERGPHPHEEKANQRVHQIPKGNQGKATTHRAETAERRRWKETERKQLDRNRKRSAGKARTVGERQDTSREIKDPLRRPKRTSTKVTGSRTGRK